MLFRALASGRLAAFVLAVVASPQPGLAAANPAPAHTPVEITPAATSLDHQAARTGALVARLGNQTLVWGGRTGETWSAEALVYSEAGATRAVPSPASPRAEAVGLVHEARLIVIGGLAPTGPSSRIETLALTNDTLSVESWPDLPLAGPIGGAGILRDRLYVLAGPGAGPGDATPFWSLDLTQPNAGWRTEADLPLSPRAHSVFAVQHGGLHIIGGTRQNENRLPTPTQDAWTFLPRPREASVLKGWLPLPPAPHPISSGAAWPAGQASIIIHAESPDGPRTLLYNAVTEGWAVLPSPTLPGGATLVSPTAAQLALAPASADSAAPALFTIAPSRYTRTLGVADYGVILAYFAIMAGIGLYFGKKQDSPEEFTLGGRKVKWWAAGLSMFATGASSISFLAIPAMAYQTNAIWILPLFMMFIAFFVQGWVIFPLLRRMQITSTFEYLEARFGCSLRLIASAQAILFQTLGRTTVVLVLPAMALSATTGINIVWSVIVMGLLTTVYTAVGGFEAVIWTDVIQGLMMLLTPLIVILLVSAEVPGGLSGAWDLLSEKGKLTLALPTWDLALPAAWILCMAALFQHTINMAGDQPVIQRVFSTPLPELRRTSATYIGSGFLIGVLVNAIGFALFVFFHHHPEQLLLTSGNDQVLPAFLVTALPAGLAGLIIAAVFAAAMSTVSSSMNSVATLLHQDFYKRFRPAATPAQNLRFLKLTAYAVGIIGTAVATYMATLQITSMFALWNTILGLLGGGIVGLYSLGMFSRRANTAGAILGAIASVVWSLWLKSTGAHFMLYLPSSVLVCMIAGYLGSLLLPGRPRTLAGLTVFDPADAQADPGARPAG